MVVPAARGRRAFKARAVACPPDVSTASTGTRKIEPHPLSDGRMDFALETAEGRRAEEANTPAPWEPGSPWADVEWTVYRGVAYDLEDRLSGIVDVDPVHPLDRAQRLTAVATTKAVADRGERGVDGAQQRLFATGR